MSDLTIPSQVLENLLREGGRVVIARYDLREGRGEWGVACEWGQEAPDSPMAAAAAYGIGDTAQEAVDAMVTDMAG